MADHGFAASAKAKFETLPDLSSSKDLFFSEPCIYKAYRQVNEECYRPYVVSIGPLYYKHPSLEDHDMQDCKLRCLKFFLDHDSNSYKSDLEHYLTILREMEGRVRECYSVSISLSSDEFNEMLLADSAFIICLFFMVSYPSLSSSSFLFHILKRSLLTWGAKLTRDLFLEENQIPMFVLDCLFQEAFGESYPYISFIDLACTFISKRPMHIPVVNQHVNAATATERIKNGPEIAHLVDLLRKFCIPPTLQDHQVTLEPNRNVTFPSSISQLRDAGVDFVPSRSDNLIDITFWKGVLVIPPFKLWDTSESYYRSMILFEKSHPPLLNKSYFIDYMFLLNCLIKTTKDVQILVQIGIIDNCMGSEERVLSLFNGIATQIDKSGTSYYFGVCEDLNAYVNSRWTRWKVRWDRWKTILKNDYFSHPWAVISVIYAILIFLLTLLQTIGTFTNK